MNKTKLKKCVFLFVLLAIFLCFLLSCADTNIKATDEIFLEIEKSYGKFAPGLFLDSRAKEWENGYLDVSIIESVFGDGEEYKRCVESAYLYISASLSLYEEVFVLQCYTSNQAHLMAGIFNERSKRLTMLEDDPLEAIVVCHRRLIVYCRLADTARANDAIRKIEE